MSSLIVEVCEIAQVLAHPNADALEVAVVKGWECIIKKDSFRPGDRVVYFPLDTVLPLELSERLGVTKYLKPLRHDYDTEGKAWGGRVGAARLRGQVSYGLLIACEDAAWKVGDDVKEHYGVSFQSGALYSGLTGDLEQKCQGLRRFADDVIARMR